MAQRGHEMGMDFEYQNRTGPMDSRSPFAQVGQNAQHLPMGSSPYKKRSTDSPPKQSTSLQSSPRKPLPPTPAAYNSHWRTPRKMNNELDDSSAGETPNKSPEHTDNDHTPDTMGRSMLSHAVTKFEGPRESKTASPDKDKGSPVKEKDRPDMIRRESFFGRIKNKLYSPGRGEIPRADHSQAMTTRVRKKRERELKRHVSRRRRHSMSDSGEDSELPARRSRQASQQKDASGSGEAKQYWISSMFTFIAQHPTVPHILSFYAQLLFNVFLLVGCAYMIYCFWAAVQGDVDKKSHEAMVDIMAEMATCAYDFTRNGCDKATRAPALESVCDSWSKCMNQDPSKIARAKLSAHTFAEIFNSFVEPISWKAMGFTFLLVFGCFATTNMAFGFFRDKTQQYQPNYYQQPPPTPQRAFSGENGQFYSTPWQQMPMGLEPQPSGGFAQIEGRTSPVRRLVYN